MRRRTCVLRPRGVLSCRSARASTSFRCLTCVSGKPRVKGISPKNKPLKTNGKPLKNHYIREFFVFTKLFWVTRSLVAVLNLESLRKTIRKNHPLWLRFEAKHVKSAMDSFKGSQVYGPQGALKREAPGFSIF